MRTLILFLVAGMLQCAPTLLRAQPQQSASFVIQKSVLDGGGGYSSSAHFALTGAFGQPSPLGQQNSSHFNLSGGFLASALLVSPLSPIQGLVIQQNAANVVLCWPRASGASSYRVYRDVTPLFTPGPANLIGTTGDTTYVDANVLSLPVTKYYYTVTALSDGLTLEALPRSDLRPTLLRKAGESGAHQSRKVEAKR